MMSNKNTSLSTNGQLSAGSMDTNTQQGAITRHVVGKLYELGAAIVAVGDLSALPAEATGNLPIGISVAVKYPKETILGISEFPTPDYLDQYNLLNEQLDMLVTKGAQMLVELGYNARAQSREKVEVDWGKFETALPQKTVATHAGIGWIGKSALLVTEEYGSMVRFSSILTDAPLEVSAPVTQSKCAGCTICTEACPGNAISGELWSAGMQRQEFFDAAKCCKTARERSYQGIGKEVTICGKCIFVCPYTQRYLKSEKV